jgi:8-oxo-dGTP pyrophosphatase MutT (NUDIX family)
MGRDARSVPTYFLGGHMKKKRIRPLAICVFRNHNRILVNQGYDQVKDEYFYRPLGGAIEFGEPSVDTVCRELMEELSVEVDRESLKYLGTLENIFTFNDSPGHEIVLIYDGALKESEWYAQEAILGKEADGEEICAVWKNLDEFITGKSILYPSGLVEMLVTLTPQDSRIFKG